MWIEDEDKARCDVCYFRKVTAHKYLNWKLVAFSDFGGSGEHGTYGDGYDICPSCQETKRARDIKSFEGKPKPSYFGE